MKKQNILLIVSIVLLILAGGYKTLAGEFTPDPKGGIINGKIIDAATNKPMEYVNIAVYKANDSSMVTGTITSENGEFRIEKLPHGDYFVKISFLGFDKHQTEKVTITPNKPVADLGIINMSSSSSNLSEVSVVAEKSKVEYQIDKRVINVDQTAVNKAGSAVNILENTPSIQVDPQGNVTLRGSSDFIVLIDGKPSVLKGSDALKQINAASIKQIEVITNPSAKYDSEGQAGIINIIRKKDYLQGLNGTINTSIGTTDKYTANALINYRKGKVNVFAGVDYADNINRGYLTINNTSYLPSGNQSVQETADQYFKNENLTGKVGIDYDLNDKNSFTFSGSYGKQGYDRGTDARYSYQLGSSDIKAFRASSNFMDVTGNVPSLTLDYLHKFKENHTLSFSSTFSAWDGRDENFLTEQIADENYHVTGLQSDLNYVKDNFNYQYRFNADYKQPVGKGTLEMGIQYRHEDREDDLRFFNFDVDSNVWIPNEQFTYFLDYLNDIYSGYATYSGTQWGIGYMLGLRSEYFTRQITFTNDTEKYNFDKFMLYPSVHLSKDIKGKHQFQLSYSRRINRPQPWLLNKQPGYVDPYNIFQGSPYLEPEYTDAFELNYRLVYKISTLSIQTYYRNTSNSFNTLRLLQDDGIMIHQLINTNQQQSYGFEASMDFNLTKWWQLSTGGNLYHYSIESLVENKQNTKDANSWDARLISNFTLKWGTRIQGVGYFQGAGIDAQGNSSGFYTVNLAVNQPIMKGKANIGLSAQNVLNSIKFDYTVKGSSFDNSYQIRAEGPIFMVTASYSFNNFQNKQRGRADDASFKGGGLF
ncbi:MAG: TonB-dependent receptor [Bacteroidales bacterium]|nr:TonB-dependent receptor [Bacteroidales bacterium]